VTRLPAAARSQAGGRVEAEGSGLPPMEKDAVRIRAREATAAANARARTAREASTPFLNLATLGSQQRSRLRLLLWCSTCSCSK